MAENIVIQQYQGATGRYQELWPKGDFYIKDETLSDTTKESLGLSSTAVPDDAFQLLKDSPEQIGDVKITKRTDLSDDWKLCDGSSIGLLSDDKAIDTFGDNGIYSQVIDTNINPTWKQGSTYYGQFGSLMVANEYLVSVLGVTPEYYDKSSQTFKPLTSLQSLSTYADGIGLWYANGYYFYGIQDKASVSTLYYSTDLFGTFTSLRGFSTRIQNVGYVEGQYIFMTNKGCYFSSDLITFTSVGEYSYFDYDYVNCSLDICIKDGYLYQVLTDSSKKMAYLFKYALPLSADSMERVSNSITFTTMTNNYPIHLYVGNDFFIMNLRGSSNYSCSAYSYSGSLLQTFPNFISFLVDDNLLYGVLEGASGNIYTQVLNSDWTGTYVSTKVPKGGNTIKVQALCKYEDENYVVFYLSSSPYTMYLYKFKYWEHSIKLPTISIGVNSYIKIK